MKGGRIIIFLFNILLFSSIISVQSQNLKDENSLDSSFPVISNEVNNELKNSERVRVLIFIKEGFDKDYDYTKEEIISSLNSNEFEYKGEDKNEGLISAYITSKGLEKLRYNQNIYKIQKEIIVETQLTQSLPLINATTVWNSLNYTGKEQTICVIDTGINASHPDLSTKIVSQYCYCSGPEGVSSNCCPGGISEGNTATDNNGHGTHVAGIIAARGGINGTAPDANLVIIKIANSSGSATDIDISKAVQRCIDNKSTYNISVISISLGSGVTYNNISLCESEGISDDEINSAYSLGIFVVAASGNGGKFTNISYPACVENATSVGSVYDANVGPYSSSGANCTDSTTQADKIACSSNRGYLLDLLAPGCVIRSTSISGGSEIMCGTSQAAPHVSGAIALLKEKYPSISTNEIRNLLKSTGKLIYDNQSNLSFPRVNAFYAISDEVNISSCRDLTRINYVYNITQNISSSGNCLTILSNNITIRGKGYIINHGINISGHGIYVNGYNNTQISNLSIEIKNTTGKDSRGIYILNSQGHTIFKNNLTLFGLTIADSFNFGIYLYNVDNSIIENNTINTTGRLAHSIYIEANNSNITSINNRISSNKLYTYGRESEGIRLKGTNGGIINNTLIFNTSIETTGTLASGIFISSGLFSKSGRTNITKSRISVKGTLSDGIYLTLIEDNFYISDTNISSSNYNDVELASGNTKNFYFLNVSYIDEAVFSGNLTRKWYLDVKVNGSVGNINQANVTGRNVSGSVQFSALTNSTGMITRQEVIEYINVGGVKNFYTNYNITASKTNYSTMYQLVNMSMNRYLTFNLMPNKIIFMTNSTFNGNLSGVSGADQLCMDDSNKPASGIYKALVGTSNRQISGSDWVLKVNTTYTRVNTSITIDTTNSQKWFTFNLENPITTDPKYVWTGLYENGSVSIYNCNNWFGSSDDGTVGDSNMASSDSIYYTEKSCPLGGRTIYCVEQ